MIQKKFLMFLALFISFAFIGKAQIKTDSLLYKKIALEACKCFEIKDYSVNLDSVYQVSERCMEKILFQFRKEVNLYQDLADSDFNEEIGRKMGRKAGMRMIPYLLRDCKKFFQMLLVQTERSEAQLDKYEEEYNKYNADSTISERVASDSTAYSYDDSTYNYDYHNNSVEGIIKSMESKNYTFLLIRDNKGVTQKFLWLHNFGEMSDKMSRNFKAYIGKKVRVEWYETECFDAKTKKYILHKEISWIDLLE